MRDVVGDDRRGFRVRLIAAAIDSVVSVIVSALLANTFGHYFAERAADAFRVGSPDTIWKGPIPMILGAVAPVSYGFAFAAILVLLMEPWFHVSPGKLLTGSIITGREGHLPRFGTAWARFFLKTLSLWIFLFALVGGDPFGVAAAAVVAALTLAGFFLVASSRSTTLHDRITGTEVRRRLPLTSIR